MYNNFFFTMRQAGIPVSLREYLTFLEALKCGVADYSTDSFYYLARTSFIKDEKKLDKFDRVFGHCFKGLEALKEEELTAEIPEEWLRKLAEKFLTKKEMEEIESLGGFDKLMETLQKRLEEQKERHQGGNKWIGTGGTSPFGAFGYNPEGVRIGQHKSRHRRAVKVWDKREFRNLDDGIELGTRNLKVALKKLRHFARTGAKDKLDLEGTIQSTAKQGYLDIKMVAEKHNAVKTLVFFDIGGSMDDHIKLCEELFSAARSEFKNMEYFYFHNFFYEGLWKDNARRHQERIPTYDILHKYPSDYKVIIVGDASMSSYEIIQRGGSVEHWNEEAGQVWMERILETYKNVIWLNPVKEEHWNYTHSIGMVKELMEGRMYPLTLQGLDNAVKELTRRL